MHDLRELEERHAFCRAEIAVFAAEVKAFTSTAFEVRTLRLPDLTWQVQARVTKQVPINFRIKAGSLINEMRTTLDALAFTLAERNGYSSNSTVYFPISKSEENFNKDGRKKMRALSAADQAKIADLKPYCGGNLVLWNLHELDRTRKHWRLTASDLAVGTDLVAVPQDHWHAGSRIAQGHQCDLSDFQWIAHFSSPQTVFLPPFCLLYFPAWEGNQHMTVDEFLANASDTIGHIIQRFS